MIRFVFLVVVMGMAGCGQAPDPEKVTDAASQAAVDYMKQPMDKAQGVEQSLQNSADRTAAESGKAGR